MSDPGKAVFLSYASQDAEAAKRIAEALRAAGVEVWFDQNELVGGDAWDAKIRRHIRECALLIPVISRTTQARREAYFRLEWKLADERTHLMAKGTPFLLPVAIDDTTERGALVPDSFVAVQWTKAPGGELPAAFVRRVVRLLAEPEAPASADPVPRPAGRTEPVRNGRALVIAGVVAVAALSAFGVWWARDMTARMKQVPAAPGTAAAAPAAPQSEARKLVAQARALIDEDLFAGRESYRLAEELGQRATTLDPTDGEAWGTLARALVGTLSRNYESTPQRREQARVAVERANRLAPQAVESGLALSEYQEFSGQVADAERTARETLERFPEDYRCVLQLAAACEAGGKSTEALALLQRCAALPGGAVHALAQEAGILRAQSRLMEAEAAVDRSLAIAPSYRAHQMRLLLAAFDFGDLERAAPMVEQLPARLQQEDLFAAISARIWLWRGEPDRALASLQRVPRDFIEEQRQYFPKGWLTGWAHQMAGRPVAAKAEWAQALAVLERRLVSEPNRRPLVVFRARLLALMGRRAEAEAALQLALELDARSPAETALTEAMVRACLGDHERAIEQLLVGHADRASLLIRGAGNTIKYDPVWAALREDPRIRRLIADSDAQLRRLRSAGGASSPSSSAPPPEAPAESVAVLAFANLSEDKANEYFSDGISEELLNVLAKVPGLKVSARTSAFYFKGRNTPIPEIAKQLGVAYVVEGSVRRSGDKVRIQAQLIQASDGFRVWSDTFTRDLKDVFAVQDEIAGLIAKNISPKLTQAATSTTTRQVDPEAFQLYLEGRALARKAGIDDLRQAIALFDRAVQRDAGFVLARAQQARAYVQLGRWGGMVPKEAWAAAKVALAPALSAEPDTPEVLVAHGWILRTADWRWLEAEAAFARALELRPSDTDMLVSAAVLKAGIGRSAEAHVLARRAVELDPLNPTTQFDLGLIYRFSDRLPEAERQFRRAIELSPGGQRYRTFLALVVVALGRLDEAEELARDEPDVLSRLFVQGLAAAGSRDEGRLREKITELESKRPTLGKLGDYSAYLASLRAAAGDLDGAMAELEVTRESRDPSIGWIKVNYLVRPLHVHPRWPEFLRSVGLADDQLK
jgi:TolB-like protein/tetratricopeptide (TPR) repeat protein